MDPFDIAARVGILLKERGESVAVAESSSGGLISAALLQVPGASVYFLGGAVVYTATAREQLIRIAPAEMKDRGVRSASEPYATWMAEQVRAQHGATWGLSETGAAGPLGNRYGDPAGHACMAVDGPVRQARTIATGNGERAANMRIFAAEALSFLEQSLLRS